MTLEGIWFNPTHPRTRILQRPTAIFAPGPVLCRGLFGFNWEHNCTKNPLSAIIYSLCLDWPRDTFVGTVDVVVGNHVLDWPDYSCAASALQMCRRPP